jgi:hypothetical protein
MEITYIGVSLTNDRIMRIVHKIQDDETIEYMGGSIPRIYVALDNK